MGQKKRAIIGITIGDPAGVGPEITAKALSNPDIRKLAEYIIFGNIHSVSKYNLENYNNIHFQEVSTYNKNKVDPGNPNSHSAELAVSYLNQSINALRENSIEALVTAPVCKESITDLGQKFSGHTEFLADAFNIKNYEMMFVSDSLRVVIVTRHIPLKDVSRLITKRKVLRTIQLVDKSLKESFKISKPRIAVCGLNPHAGEGGSLGKEENLKIIPALSIAKNKGINVQGPLPADTLFSLTKLKEYDVIIAMYHDQGLIPVKTLCFSKVVNLTIGLPFVRTSPAHGTAFDISGKGIADASSMVEAIKVAASLSLKK